MMNVRHPIPANLTTIGSRIAFLRKAKNIDRETVLTTLDISHATLSRIENGVTNLSSDKIVKLSHLFDVSCDYLLTGHEFISSNVQEVLTTQAYNKPEIYELLTLYQKLTEEKRMKVITYINFIEKF